MKLTKAQKAEINTEMYMLEEDINLMLFQALGFDVKNGFVISQDTFVNITFRGKCLKYKSNNADQLILHSNDILFDPLNNLKLAMDLFSRFLYTESQENNLYIQSYFTTNKADTTSLTIHKLNGVTIDILCSDYYYNPAYCYIDMIFGLYGIDYTNKLHRLDELKSYDL